MPPRLFPGDRVRNTSNDGPKGGLGTVVMVLNIYQNEDNPTTGVMYDKEEEYLHDCSGQAPNYPVYKNHHCWWNSEKDLEFLSHGPDVQPVEWRPKGKVAKGMTPTTTMNI